VTITHGYTSLSTAKTRQGIGDTADDQTIETVITTVSRMIDEYCGRRFYAVTETRLYSAPMPPYPFYTVAGPTFFTAPRPTRMLVDDLLSVSSLVTDEDASRAYATVWAATDYDLFPPNAPLDGHPYWEIRCSPLGNFRFPYTALGIKVTGSFGFSATTPPNIEEVCLVQTALLFTGGVAAPLGIRAGGVVAQEVRTIGLHPFAKRLLEPYIRAHVG